MHALSLDYLASGSAHGYTPPSYSKAILSVLKGRGEHVSKSPRGRSDVKALLLSGPTWNLAPFSSNQADADIGGMGVMCILGTSTSTDVKISSLEGMEAPVC